MSTELARLLNASGFAIQMAVEHAVRSSGGHNFEVVAREHPRRDPQHEKEGYIDLVLQSSAVMWAVECKRARDATWVFLVDQTKRDLVAKIRCHRRTGRRFLSFHGHALPPRIRLTLPVASLVAASQTR